MSQQASIMTRTRMIGLGLFILIGLVALFLIGREVLIPLGMLKPVLLLFSGGFLIGCIFMAYLGIQRSVVSYRAGAAFVSIGGAVGGALFVYSIGGDVTPIICAAIVSAVCFGIGALIGFIAVMPLLK